MGCPVSTDLLVIVIGEAPTILIAPHLRFHHSMWWYVGILVTTEAQFRLYIDHHLLIDQLDLY